ncbi:facilitated trehalose transporter Tret1-2 homolog [Anticarsia gemmatalis]|uniref:facilitated trehalose transporter Tret1-2 homolog n=1 Tax=Anticarsia gemmatalis TaxID=129554 RepID=UPI003F75970E
MECQYKKIPSKENKTTDVVSQQWKQWQPLLRQMLVSSGVWAMYFTTGLGLGAPTVFIPQLRREANATEVLTDEMATWLSSVFGFVALPWILIISFLIRYIGRKKTFSMVSFNTIMMFVVFYCSRTPQHLLITEIIQGMTHASNTSVSIVVVSEYTSPKYRGLLLTIKTATLLWGIWVSNTIGTFFHWSYIPVVGFFFAIYTTTVFLWPESPYWLASQGKFDECQKAHRWLKGTDEDSEKELQSLIDSQIVYRSQNKHSSCRNMFTTLKLKVFYMPLFISMLLVAQFYFSGKLVCSIYAIDIIKKITDSESTAYIGMLILDGVTVFSLYIGCALAKILKRRTLLFISTTIGILFLFIMSLYLYLVKLEIVTENKYLSIFLLACFSWSISCGPILLSTSIYAELIPLRFKSTGITIIACSFNGLQAILLKSSPYIFRTFGMHGTFLFYGIAAAICTLALYKCLPETKDKTLQEIEEYFEDNYEVNLELVKRENVDK